MKLSIIVVLAALAVVNAGSVDVKLQDKKITITPKAADAWQSLISPLTTKETLPVDVPVRWTCHAIQRGFYGTLCEQKERGTEPCKVWEKPISCTASGWPVCCQGSSGGSTNNPYWYKAGQKCADLHPDGVAPFAACKSSDAKTVVKTGTSALPVSSTLVSPLKSAADTGCYVGTQGCSGTCAGGYCGATSAGACACYPASLRRRTTPPPPPSKCDAKKKLCQSDGDCEKAPSGCKTCRDDGPILNPPLQCKYLSPGDCYCQTAPGPSPGPSPTGCYVGTQGCSGTCAGGYCSATSAGACACYPGRAAFMN